MSAGVEVRLGMLSDLDAVLQVERETATAPHWSGAEYRRILTPPAAGGEVERCLYVAVRQEELLGFAVGRIIGLGLGIEAEIESIAVRQAERSRGVGRRLLQALMVWLRVRGAADIGLEVRASGVAARTLYEGMGFVATGRRPGYYSDPPDDAVVMRWTRGAMSR